MSSILITGIIDHHQYELSHSIPLHIPLRPTMTRCLQNVKLALRCILIQSHGPRTDDGILWLYDEPSGLTDLTEATLAHITIEQLIVISKHSSSIIES